jgi:hypothetical protein
MNDPMKVKALVSETIEELFRMAACSPKFDANFVGRMEIRIAQINSALSAHVEAGQQEKPEQEADLYEAEKLVPYETRYFKSPGMAEALGYKVLAKYRKVAAPPQAEAQSSNNKGGV